MTHDPLWILAVLLLCLAIAEWLAQHTWLRHLGAALLVIVLGALVANLGVIPTGSEPVPLYDGVFGPVAKLAIALLLLRVDLASVLRAGGPMLVAFALGAAGTVAGVFAGLAAVGGADSVGALHPELGGMFSATYIGGSLNFNAVALARDVPRAAPLLYTGAVAIDSIMTTLWMVATLLLPGALSRGRPRAAPPTAPSDTFGPAELPGHHDVEDVGPADLALVLALGCAIVLLSDLGSAALAEAGLELPAMVVLTTLALALAQLRAVRRLRGTRLLGMLAVHLFLTVIGAYCDLGALAELGALGGTLFAFVTVLLLVHGAVIYGGALLLRIDPAVASVASQANIGGGTTALALARSLDRADLVVPGLLVGSLGTALGTYVGFQVMAWLA